MTRTSHAGTPAIVRVRALWTALLASPLLVACGGGGGGGGSSPPPPPPPAVASHKVGGTVSGLVGPGLVITDNAGDPLTLSSNGAFSFASSVVEGGAYGVAIRTKPPSPAQTCLVSSGTGTVATTDVTSVRIDCSVNTHRLGGTVTGLAGGGLVLGESDGDRVTPAADGAFTFATAKPSGSQYLVSVAAQPANPSQTCTVGGGTSHGTIADADVADVAVVCATNAFSINGLVSGLSGGGLVLQDNGADDVSVPGNGGFGFATPVASGAAYKVSVKTQPTNPSQVCSVGSGAGLVTSGDVASVAVRCATSAFSVRGTVTGLSGHGLVLEDNGADDLAVAATGNFVFPTGVVSGAGYTVTVRTQPSNPAQTCTVGAGSTGTIAAVDATGVQVVCSTNSYAVGGTVQGLAGRGLVLEDNGGDDVSVAVDGTFTFPTPVASGGSYTVTVRGAPVAPRQSCVVANGTGAVSGADVADVQVTCTTSPARWAFLSNYFSDSLSNTTYDGDVTTYAIDPVAGTLGSPGTPASTGRGGAALAVTPSGKFAYVANKIYDDATMPGGSVSSYVVDPATGALTANGPEIYSGLGTQALTIDPAGRFVYVANYDSGSITVFAIAPLTGRLTQVQNASAASPLSLAIEPGGRFLYVAQTNANTVGVFAIDAGSGQLTHVSDASTGSQPKSIAIDPAGRFAFALDYGTNTTPAGVLSFAIDPSTGALTFVNALSSGISPNRIVVHPSGRFVYVTNTGEWSLAGYFIPTGSVSVFSVDPTSGKLTQPLAEITTGGAANCLAIDPTGRFAWLQNNGSDAVNPAAVISQYAVDPTTGALHASAPDLPAYGCVTTW